MRALLMGGGADDGGVADQKSSVSNNLNIGKITPRSLDNSPAGGVVGRLKSNSLANNNVNTGEVNAGHTEDSGGIVGKAETTSRVLHNLNTGKIASDYLDGTSRRSGGEIGGIVGETSGQTLVSKNLNTGSISGKVTTNVGGITGGAVNAPVVQNVNTGTVTTDGRIASAGGIAGKAIGRAAIYHNLNAGAVIGNGTHSSTGGISGSARDLASVYNNVNTGLVKSLVTGSYESGAVAEFSFGNDIVNNLDTFTKYYPTDSIHNGYNEGVVRKSKSALKSGLNGLSSELWNAGDATQLPMLRGINTPYRELVRINGTQQTNNQFPIVLNEFADPGGAANATSFNRTVWNGHYGYLPFLKVFSRLQILLAGIDCTPGGFDCRVKKNITTTPPATSSSSAQPSTIDLTTAAEIRALADSESPSGTSSAFEISSPTNTRRTKFSSSSDSTSPTTDSLDLSNCLPPKGKPLFQTYDAKNQQIYVVIQPESSSKGIVLARYKGSELDKPFGRCGIVTYTTSADHSIILDSYQSLTGQVTHEATGSQLNLVATTPSGKTTLFEFPLNATQKYPAQLIVRDKVFPESVQINDTAYHNGFMY
ncbi:hypothetical protein, partial [Endozoicomonas sp. SESOKO3]|uniref:hypothetical protein n=1 Tax=Endozoicomonas sp. SESOKO3 TaxID=2828744 RepID=UPI002148C288